jgi:hypothetical protein
LPLALHCRTLAPSGEQDLVFGVQTWSTQEAAAPDCWQNCARAPQSISVKAVPEALQDRTMLPKQLCVPGVQTALTHEALPADATQIWPSVLQSERVCSLPAALQATRMLPSQLRAPAVQTELALQRVPVQPAAPQSSTSTKPAPIESHWTRSPARHCGALPGVQACAWQVPPRQNSAASHGLCSQAEPAALQVSTTAPVAAHRRSPGVQVRAAQPNPAATSAHARPSAAQSVST